MQEDVWINVLLSSALPTKSATKASASTDPNAQKITIVRQAINV